MDNSNDPLNTTDKLFSEKMPESLRQSILAQAHTELASVRGRERIKSISYFFGGLVAASVVGVSITRNLVEKKNSANGLAAQDLEFGESLNSELEIADWQNIEQEADFEMMANLEDMENLTEEEFAYISSEEDV